MPKRKNETLVVGICGKARAGKDTIASMLSKQWINEGVYVSTLSMATPIKEMIQSVFGGFLPEEKEKVIEGIGASPRVLYQTLGTDWGRHMIDEDIWVNCAQRRIDDLKRWAFSGVDFGWNVEQMVLFIPDIRFDNERQLCDVLLEVRRPDGPKIVEHESEEGVSPELVDCIIMNDGTLDDLRSEVLKAMEEILDEINFKLPCG